MLADVRALAEDGDEMALRIFGQQAMALGWLFSIAANYSDPHAYFIGGGVLETAPHFRDWFVDEVSRHTQLRTEQQQAAELGHRPRPRRRRRPRLGDRRPRVRPRPIEPATPWLEAALDGGDQLGAEVGGLDDAVHRTDLAGPLDAVHGVELGGHVAQLLGAHRTRGRPPARPAGRRRSSGEAAATASSAARTRSSARVRSSTSRVNTTAAAGAPPITEANEPSTASTSMSSFNVAENTTNAPPW